LAVWTPPNPPPMITTRWVPWVPMVPPPSLIRLSPYRLGRFGGEA
jgi:hypothetical protein